MNMNVQSLINKIEAERSAEAKYHFPIQPPALLPGVVPKGAEVPVAMDSASYDYAKSAYANHPAAGFPGYSYLAMLATRAEFRAFASSLAIEITREWIKLTSSNTAGPETAERVTKLEQEIKRLNLQQVIRSAAENDCYFGRGQIFIDINGAEKNDPLILSPKTVKKGSLKRIKSIEPMWTTPVAYNALDPTAPDFYKPTKWFMLGQEVHAQRLLTVVTRELPDMLKPAYNFSGMSLSQLAEPYVDNWLRTRQNVSDLISKFSIVAMKTSMEQILAGGDDSATEAAGDLVNRVKLFNLMRNNFGTMLLDKEREELVMLNVPLSGLHELQAQAQEQMCSVAHLPAVILTGISPTGFGNLAEGELQAHYNNISATQEAHWREPIDILLKVAQLSLFGEIDPDISFEFNPLYQMTQKELAEIQKAKSETATAYINAGVIGPDEERERLARDPESGYQGLDTSISFDEPEPDGEEEPDEFDEDEARAAMDEEFEENEHPRDNNGKFAPEEGAKNLAASNIKWVKNQKQNATLAAEALTKAGFKAFTENPSGAKTNKRFAAIGSPTNGILVNHRSPYWKDPVFSGAQNFSHGHLSTEDPKGILLHEIAHTIYDPAGYWDSKSQEEIAKKVSKYAATNPKEFVSEVFAGLHTSKKYDEDVMNLYKRYTFKKHGEEL